MSSPPIIRIIARRVSWPDIRVGGNRTGLRLLWDALDESGTLIVAATEYPLADASNALIRRGENPDTLVTMRHEEASYDSFVPVPLRIPATLSERRAARAATVAKRLRRTAHRSEMPEPVSEGGVCNP